MTAPATGPGPLLEVRALRTWFHTDAGIARAVDGIDFQVQPGEIVGLVGESGSGKSVTALSIMQLVPRPPGELMAGSSIRFRGEELVGASGARLRALRGADIAMIFQEPMTSLNPVLQVGRQIGEVLRVHRGLAGKAVWRRTVELLELVGIPEPERRSDDYPHQLSGGQRQRVMIAMARAGEPELLIADEPTTALDVTIQAQILDLIAELRARLGMAVLLITHDLGVVAGVCDRVLVMYAGQIVEQGPGADVFREPHHPYTEGLLRAIPRLGHATERLAVIPGAVPSPLAWPPTCRFHPRCPYAWEACAAHAPGLIPLDGRSGASRCWLEPHPERRAGRGYGDVRSGAELP
ncbi:MAG: ABC transporter ATP-binding protein [Gemmatimonadetes bacterium]|nr:ABC transporter ATP-binding protein [Gemmatimonadota bacterium]